MCPVRITSENADLGVGEGERDGEGVRDCDCDDGGDDWIVGAVIIRLETNQTMCQSNLAWNISIAAIPKLSELTLAPLSVAIA